MKLFLIGAISCAAVFADEAAEYTGMDEAHLATADDERTLEGLGLLSDVSGMDLVLSTAVNQAVSSTVVPVVGLAGGFARSAIAFVTSLSNLKPNSMLPTSFYNTVNQVIQSFANPSTGQINQPVAMDEFLDRLRASLSAQSVVDFDGFKRVCDNLKKIVLLYPFVMTGSYLTYLSQVLGTLQAVLTAAHPYEPTPRPATIPLVPHTHGIPLLPSFTIPSVRVDPANLNIPNMGFTGTIDGGVLGQLTQAFNNVKAQAVNLPRIDTLINPSWKLFGLDQLKSPLFTGVNALGALGSMKTSALGSLIAPISSSPTTHVVGPGDAVWQVTGIDNVSGQPIISASAQPAHSGLTMNGAPIPILQQLHALYGGQPILAAKQAIDQTLGSLAGPLLASHLESPLLQSHPYLLSQLTSHMPDWATPTAMPPIYNTNAGHNEQAIAVGSHPIPSNHPLLASHPWLANNPLVASHTIPADDNVGSSSGSPPMVTRPSLLHPVHPLVAAQADAIQQNGGYVHPLLTARMQSAGVLPSRWGNQFATEEVDDQESEAFVWSLPDASVYFLQRLDLLRPSDMAPATFLHMLNNKIQEMQNDEMLDYVTPEDFVHHVAGSLTDPELTEEVLNSISRRVEGILDENFPALADILTHITNIISQKLEA